MQWDLERTGSVGVLRLSGFLGTAALHRFDGALAWARARCGGPIVLDLSGLLGWNADGEAAIVDASGHPSGGHDPLAVCGLGARRAPLLDAAAGAGVLLLYRDADTALAALVDR